jgi:hypothetical protein
MAVNWKRSRKQPKINNVAKFQSMSVERRNRLCQRGIQQCPDEE